MHKSNLQEIEIESQIIAEETEQKVSAKRSLFLSFVLLNVFVLALFFGGRYYVANYLAYVGAFLMLGYSIIKHESALEIFTKEGQFSPIWKLTLYLTAFFFIQYLFVSSSNLLLDTAVSWYYVLAVFLVTTLYLTSIPVSFISRAIIFSGFLVSLVGLSHWFYDTGLLFWSFEPENVFNSERARWPFVNSNHLGNYLLLTVFFAVASLGSQIEKFRELIVELGSRKAGFSKAFLSSKRVPKHIIRIGLDLIVILTIALCITATLSRGSWTGLGIGLLSYLTLNFIFFRTKNRVNLLLVNSDDKNIFKIKLLNYAKRFYKPVLAIMAFAVFLFFLNEQGQELVQGRIEYGLLYSLSDIRWTMYADTWNMFKDHLFFGVGLGQWASNYPAYMDESLSGINPVYLHSEPIQTLAELGLFGIVPLLVLYFKLFKSSLKKVVDSKDLEVSRLVSAVICGVLAFTIASLVEFPLRMPAIQALLAVNLAILYTLVVREEV